MLLINNPIQLAEFASSLPVSVRNGDGDKQLFAKVSDFPSIFIIDRLSLESDIPDRRKLIT